MLHVLIAALHMMFSQSDSAKMLNPYESSCYDTCVVLPIPVFRQTTTAVVERNYFHKEIESRKTTDSLLRQRILLDSIEIDNRHKQFMLSQLNNTDLREASKKNQYLWCAYGFGAGIITTVISGIILLIAVN